MICNEVLNSFHQPDVEAIEKMAHATGVRAAPRGKTKPPDISSVETSDWIRQMIIVRGRKQKN